MSDYNPFDWYWSVQDTSPGTQVWASARGLYVVLADASYVAWLVAGNVATNIDTQANLFQLINAFNIDYFNSHWDPIQNVTLIGGTPIQLTNPMAKIVEVTPVAGAILDLPQANLFGSPPIGQPIWFNTVGRNPNWVLKTFGGGSTLLSAAFETIVFWMTDNGTTTGTWTGLTLTTPVRPTAGAQILVSKSTFAADGRFYNVALSGDATIDETGILTLGTVALAKGGTHADLSATGGTSKFLRQNSTGANIDVVQPVSTDLSDTTAPTSFSPTDQSGAALTFSSVNVQYCKYGNLVYVYGTLTYPATADGSSASFSLPVAVPAASYATVPGSFVIGGTGLGEIVTLSSSSRVLLIQAASGASYTNVLLSGKLIRFMLIYPAA